MKRMFIIFCAVFFLAACAGESGTNENATSEAVDAAPEPEVPEAPYDTAIGAGEFRDIQLSENLDPAKVATGQKIYEMKCQACHKLTTERLTGPGWGNITHRHEPEWIMNFMTNTDEMLDVDPKAQAMLDICMVRMPDQNLTDEDAFAILAFMRKNDGVK